MSTIIMRIEKPGEIAPVSEWAITFPVDESLLEDPCAFGAYALKAVEHVRSGSWGPGQRPPVPARHTYTPGLPAKAPTC